MWLNINTCNFQSLCAYFCCTSPFFVNFYFLIYHEMQSLECKAQLPAPYLDIARIHLNDLETGAPISWAAIIFISYKHWSLGTFLSFLCESWNVSLQYLSLWFRSCLKIKVHKIKNLPEVQKSANEVSKNLRERTCFIYWHILPHLPKLQGGKNIVKTYEFECLFSYQCLTWHYSPTLRGNGITLDLQAF